MWVGKPINYTSQEMIGSSVFDVWDLGYILDFHIDLLSLEIRLNLGREIWVRDTTWGAIVILIVWKAMRWN